MMTTPPSSVSFSCQTWAPEKAWSAVGLGASADNHAVGIGGIDGNAVDLGDRQIAVDADPGGRALEVTLEDTKPPSGSDVGRAIGHHRDTVRGIVRPIAVGTRRKRQPGGAAPPLRVYWKPP